MATRSFGGEAKCSNQQDILDLVFFVQRSAYGDVDFRMRCSDHRSMRRKCSQAFVIWDFNCKVRDVTTK